MSLSAALLQRLAGLASPAGSVRVSATPAQGMDFASLLSKVEQGQISSGTQVTSARGLAHELSSGEIATLSKAADLAESRGATQVAVRMQGMMYTVDIGVRQVTSVQPANHEPLLGIDALIDLDAAAAGAAQAPAIGSDPLRSQHGLNQTLRTILTAMKSAA
ncbi:MAG: hypothetical protein KGS45_10185 [Planctomycetes bacterium]|nr:hypothetical protein [Planctomycetota bacterium]